MASPRSVVVTYYEGDINTVVDEHFFRALSRNNTPKDLSVKHRGRPTPRHTGEAHAHARFECRVCRADTRGRVSEQNRGVSLSGMGACISAYL